MLEAARRRRHVRRASEAAAEPTRYHQGHCRSRIRAQWRFAAARLATRLVVVVVVGVDCRRGRGRRITALFGQGNISGNYLP